MSKSGMFGDYVKKLEKLTDDVPKIFKKVAHKGAAKFVKKAKQLTDEEKLVDTGNYKASWYAKVDKSDGGLAIVMGNTANYASHLEYDGIKRDWKGRFVGSRARIDTEGAVLLYLEEELQNLVNNKKLGLD